MPESYFKGSLVALVTPFQGNGELDLLAFKNLVDWHAEIGTDAIVCCGTTGENPTLTPEEQLLIFRTAVDVARKRVPIIAGTGTYDTLRSVEETEKAKALGVDGCLVVVPYYNRPTPEGVLAHFKALSSVGLPMIVYYHPARTGLTLSAKILADVCQLPSVVGLKEASGTLEMISEFKQYSSLPVFAGDDTLAYALMEQGAIGVISIVANIIPREWKLFTQSFLKGEQEYARTISDYFHPLCESLVVETNPQGIKHALSLMKRCQPYLRLPLVQPRPETKSLIEKRMRELQLLERSFLDLFIDKTKSASCQTSSFSDD